MRTAEFSFPPCFRFGNIMVRFPYYRYRLIDHQYDRQDLQHRDSNHARNREE
jgi:hypothetical protein